MLAWLDKERRAKKMTFSVANYYVRASPMVLLNHSLNNNIKYGS